MKTTLFRSFVALFAALFIQTAHAGLYDDLMTAVNIDDTDTVVALLNRGMDVNSVDMAGNTLLHIAARNGNNKLLEILLKKHANPLVRNRVGDTALMLAAYTGRIEAADILLANGAEINMPGWTALHYSVFAEQVEMTKHLLGKGASVDARAPNEQTALMIAAKNGNLAILRMLLNAGASLELVDQANETAASIARKQNNPDVIALLDKLSKKTEPVAAQPLVETPAVAPVKPKPAPEAKPAEAQPASANPKTEEAIEGTAFPSSPIQ